MHQQSRLGSESKLNLNQSPHFKALVVDDKELERLIIGKILSQHNFDVAYAHDKASALDRYQEFKPDVIFMDYYLEKETGIDITTLIRDIPQEKYIPIIFVAGSGDDELLGNCLNAGGDDFIYKPVSEKHLVAKTNALLRIKKIHDEVISEKKQINKENKIHEKDLIDADKVLYNIHAPLFDSSDNFKWLFKPQNILSGDLICSAISPSGQHLIIVGDNTGHGTPAALGTLIVSEIFYSMVKKGFDIIQIVDEINKKLCRLLPIDRFFAANIIEVDENFEYAKLYNAGMPDMLVCDAYGSIKYTIKSMSQPLGIMNVPTSEIVPQNIKLYHGDYIYAYTDGITEACNIKGEFYGQERFNRLIESVPNNDHRFDYIKDEFDQFVGEAEQTDDILMVELKCIKGQSQNKNISRTKNDVIALDWKLQLNFESEAIKNNNPVPMFLHMMSEIQGLGRHRQKIFLILTEMYSNAIEHGLLDMDSSLKAQDDGFAYYYKLRQERLDKLEDALLKIEIISKTEGSVGLIDISFEHNGTEFESGSYKKALETNLSTSGRGMALLYELCRSVEFSNNGKKVQVQYEMN